MSRALALGKFAPLHRGHQLVLDRATAETDEQVFVIYDSPSVTDIPLHVRASWLRQLYPKALVLEAWGASEEVGLTPELTQHHEEFLVQLLQGREITHFYSSEPYGERVARRLGAMDVRVDESRIQQPISATDIRASLYEHRNWLDPVVYRDLVRKVVFLGAPSTGKSTIAEACANAFDTNFMPEYGREYWEQHSVDRRLSMTQLEEIALGHRQREDSLIADSNGSFFIDTDASTTAIFADYYFGHRSPLLNQVSQEASSRYDLTFLCANDFPYADTEDRSGEANQVEFQLRIREQLRAQKRPFVELTGSLSHRIDTVKKLLAEVPHYGNPTEWSKHD